MRKLSILLLSFLLIISPVYANTATAGLERLSFGWVGKALQAKYNITYNGITRLATGAITRYEMGALARMAIGRTFVPLVILSAIANSDIKVFDDGKTKNYYTPVPVNDGKVTILQNTTDSQPRLLDNGNNCQEAYNRFLANNTNGVKLAQYVNCTFDAIQKKYSLGMIVLNPDANTYDPYKRPQTFSLGTKTITVDEFVKGNNDVKVISNVPHYALSNEQLGEVIATKVPEADLGFFTDYTADFQSPAALRAVDSVKTDLSLPSPIPYPYNDVTSTPSSIPLVSNPAIAGSTTSTVVSDKPIDISIDTPIPTTTALPDFCIWAKPVCDFFKDDTPQDEKPRPPTPASLSDVGLETIDRYKLRIKFPSTCPTQTLSLTLFNRTYSHPLPLQSVCEVLDMASPIFVAMAFLGVAFYVVREIP